MVIWLYGHNYVKGGALPAAVCAAAAWNSATATSQGWAQSNTSIYGYMTKKYCNSLVNRIFPTWLLQSNSPTATSQGWAQSNTSMWSHDQKNISIDQFRYIILGGNDNLFWSQPPPPIYPNILHNIVTLVEKHRIIDKNKYETTQKLIYFEIGLFFWVNVPPVDDPIRCLSLATSQFAPTPFARDVQPGALIGPDKGYNHNILVYQYRLCYTQHRCIVPARLSR